MQIVRRAARRGVVVLAGMTLAGGAMIAAGTTTAAAEANIDAGAVTLSRPAVTDAPAQVCAEGTMLIERDGARRIEHADCSVTDVMGVTVTRAAADAASSTPVFGERAVPAVQAAGVAAADPAGSDYAGVAAPQVLGEIVQQAPVVVDPVSQPLPMTGSEVLPMAVGGLGALVMGVAAVLIARRRRSEVLEAG